MRARLPEQVSSVGCNAMINNYRTKIEILEQVLEKIQSINQKTNPSPAGLPSGEGDTKVEKTESDEISI